MYDGGAEVGVRGPVLPHYRPAFFRVQAVFWSFLLPAPANPFSGAGIFLSANFHPNPKWEEEKEEDGTQRLTCMSSLKGKAVGGGLREGPEGIGNNLCRRKKAEGNGK